MSTPLQRATADWIGSVRADERERCAALVGGMRMSEILLAGGEMSAQERRTVKALLPWLANKIRNQKDM